jgi:GxxExxY protein
MDTEHQLHLDEEQEPDPQLNRITNAILGAAIEVHRILGPGFLESVYKEALAIEFAKRGIAFHRQGAINLQYKDQRIGEGRLDFLVEGKVIVELKAVEAISPLHSAQMISYLKMTRLRLGLILNFNTRALKDGIKRIAL